MVIARHKIRSMYIAAKRFRNDNISFVYTAENAQKFTSFKAARDLIYSWGLDVDEYELSTYYYPSQEGFTRVSKKADF
jgi:hypothetical protein